MVDESHALQMDRGVGSKVGGWDEKNLKVVLLSIPPRPPSTHNTTPRFHDYSPISLFCLPGPGSCSFNGLILQLRLKALFLFIIIVIMESQSSSIWSPLSCVWRGVHYQLMRDVRPRVMKYTWLAPPGRTEAKKTWMDERAVRVRRVNQGDLLGLLIIWWTFSWLIPAKSGGIHVSFTFMWMWSIHVS